MISENRPDPYGEQRSESKLKSIQIRLKDSALTERSVVAEFLAVASGRLQLPLFSPYTDNLIN